MRRRVRIYIEGGAEGRAADNDFRRGWKTFLRDLHALAREHGFQSLEIVRGKSRTNAFNRFRMHKQEHPEDLCVLLVDAERTTPEDARLWDFVSEREGGIWQRPAWATENHLYLMVVFVETWLVSDPDALRRFFGRYFDQGPLPTTNLEARSKGEIERALRKATQNSPKGPYRHGQAHQLIGLVDPATVMNLYHGQRLFQGLGRMIQGDNQPGEGT